MAKHRGTTKQEEEQRNKRSGETQRSNKVKKGTTTKCGCNSLVLVH
jgi:hypothetical protein